LNKRLSQLGQDLCLALNIQELFEQKQDRKDQRRDSQKSNQMSEQILQQQQDQNK
ncbi:unnamed protein product, partial [Rotaria magnacalcarata]